MNMCHRPPFGVDEIKLACFFQELRTFVKTSFDILVMKATNNEWQAGQEQEVVNGCWLLLRSEEATFACFFQELRTFVKTSSDILVMKATNDEWQAGQEQEVVDGCWLLLRSGTSL